MAFKLLISEVFSYQPENHHHHMKYPEDSSCKGKLDKNNHFDRKLDVSRT